MLDYETRVAIWRLSERGHGLRAIARAVGVSRNAARLVLRSGAREVPRLERDESLAAHLDLVRDLHGRCEGNLVRVQEELAVHGVETAYSTLTAFCRRHGSNQLVADHGRCQPGARQRVLAGEHRGQRRRFKPSPPSHEETTLRAADPALDQLCSQLRTRHGGRAIKAVRWLHRMYLDYPSDALIDAVATAQRFGLCDLARIERIALERIAGDIFQLPVDDNDNDNDKEIDDG